MSSPDSHSRGRPGMPIVEQVRINVPDLRVTHVDSLCNVANSMVMRDSSVQSDFTAISARHDNR